MLKVMKYLTLVLSVSSIGLCYAADLTDADCEALSKTAGGAAVFMVQGGACTASGDGWHFYKGASTTANKKSS